VIQEQTYSTAASDWTVRLLQGGHRLAIVATLLLVATFVMVLLEKPADQVAVAGVLAADGAIVLSGILLLRAYRTARPLRQILGLLLFSLVIAHLAGYLLLDRFEHLAAWRTSPAVQSVLQSKTS
jgi:K+ transporter